MKQTVMLNLFQHLTGGEIPRKKLNIRDQYFHVRSLNSLLDRSWNTLKSTQPCTARASPTSRCKFRMTILVNVVTQRFKKYLLNIASSPFGLIVIHLSFSMVEWLKLSILSFQIIIELISRLERPPTFEVFISLSMRTWSPSLSTLFTAFACVTVAFFCEF